MHAANSLPQLALKFAVAPCDVGIHADDTMSVN